MLGNALTDDEAAKYFDQFDRNRSGYACQWGYPVLDTHQTGNCDALTSWPGRDDTVYTSALCQFISGRYTLGK